MATVELRELDEAFLRNLRGRRRHRTPIELAHRLRQPGTTLVREAEPVSGAPAVRAEQQVTARRDGFRHKRAVALKAARREQQRLRVRGRQLAEPDVDTRGTYERVGEAGGLEAKADRARISCLLPHDWRPER